MLAALHSMAMDLDKSRLLCMVKIEQATSPGKYIKGRRRAQNRKEDKTRKEIFHITRYPPEPDPS